MGNLQVRFLEGWAPAMAPGHSTVMPDRVCWNYFCIARRSDTIASVAYFSLLSLPICINYG
jgi:hypothetical protein